MSGVKCSIRPIRLSDATQHYVDWLNDKDVNKYLESRFSPATLSSVHAYVRDAMKEPDTYFFAILDSKSGQHIGNIKLGPINRHHLFAEIGFLIGDKIFWGKGCGSEAIQLVEQLAFGELGIHKLTAGAYANNIGSIKVLEKCGFIREGLLKSQCLCDGEFVDGIRFGKLKHV